MINFVVLILPATYMIENLAGRTILLIGCLLNTGNFTKYHIIWSILYELYNNDVKLPLGGAVLKALAVKPNLFPLMMFGQVISQCTWSFVNQMPGKIATQWFLEDEISLATSISVSGWLIGCAFGYVVPPIVLHGPQIPSFQNENSVNYFSNQTFSSIEWDETDFKTTENQLVVLQSTIAGVCFFLTVILMVIYNKDKIGVPNIAESR